MFDHSANIHNAMMKCQHYTETHNGAEYGIVLCNFHVLFELDGNNSYIQFRRGQIDAMHQAAAEGGQIDVVHSHPTEVSFSKQDLIFTTRHHCRIWVITPNGFMARSNGFCCQKNLMEDWLYERSMVVHQRLGIEYYTKESLDFQGTTEYPLISALEHVELIQAAAEGIVDYSFTYEFDPEFRKMVDRAKHADRLYKDFQEKSKDTYFPYYGYGLNSRV